MKFSGKFIQKYANKQANTSMSDKGEKNYVSK